MPEPRPPERDKPDADALSRGYETSDVSAKLLAVLLGGFVLLAAVLGGGLWWFYRVELRHAPRGEQLSAVDVPVATDAPPLQPQVGHESLDNWDLQKMRAKEDQTLERLGWKRDERTHRMTVPDAVIATLQQRQAATRPAGGGR